MCSKAFGMDCGWYLSLAVVFPRENFAPSEYFAVG